MFRGTCTINRETVDEVAEIMCARIRLIYSMIALIAAVLLILLYIGKSGSADQETRIVMAMMNILIMGALLWFSKRSLNKTYSRVADSFVEQVRSVYQSDSVSRTLEFEGALMTLDQNGEIKQQWMNTLLKVYETRTQIVLQMKDNLYLWIAKDSIEGGSPEEFKAYLSTYEKKGKA